MAGQETITTLSEVDASGNREGNAVLMVGSFAPIHKGHFDAVRAASSALMAQGEPVEAIVFTPNSAEYVARKLPECHVEWTYERRIARILEAGPLPYMPTYVDDISGRRAKTEQINRYVPPVIRERLGFVACQTYFVVGSDQLMSMESHLENEENRAICVLRPGSLDVIERAFELPWVSRAVEAGRYIFTERDDMDHDISSTAIRTSVVANQVPILVQ